MSKIEFRITGSGFGDLPVIPITETEWESINRARSFVYNLYYIEQKYDLMISNYYEFEENLLKQALDRSIWSRGVESMDDDLLSTARKIINLITSIVLYTEQVEKRHIKRFGFNDKKEDKVFGDFTSFLKRSNYYKFTKGLRDYIAHRDLPIDSYSYSSSWETVGKDEEEKLGHFVVPTVKKEKLLLDRKFSSRVVHAMDSSIGKIDLRVPVRKTIADLSKIADEIRKSLSQDYEESKKEIIKAIDRYKEKIDGNFFQCKVEKIKDGKVFESKNLQDRSINRIELLFKRNRSQKVLERRYVHNRL